MKELLGLLAIIAVITAVSCNKAAPNEPAVPTSTRTATPQNSATATPMASEQDTSTVTPTATITVTPLVNILVDDFEDGTLLQDLIDPPNNPWTFTNDSASGGASAWSGQDHCGAPNYFGFGSYSMSLSGTVKANISTTGQYMGYLWTRATTMTGGQGIDATQYGNLVISIMSTAVPPSGNMLYTFRLYNGIGQYISYSPTLTSTWNVHTVPWASFTANGAPDLNTVLSNLCSIEVRVQIFTTVQYDEAPFNLCIDNLSVTLP